MVNWIKKLWRRMFPRYEPIPGYFQISEKGIDRLKDAGHPTNEEIEKNMFMPKPGGGWYVPEGMTKEQFDAGHPNIKMTAVGSEQVLAPLETKMVQSENVFGGATIVNESDRMVFLRNSLYTIILKPGERHHLT